MNDDDTMTKMKSKWWWERSAHARTNDNECATGSSLSPASINVDDDDKEDIGATKMKWWERSTLARTYKKGAKGDSAASIVDDDGEDGKPEPVLAVSKQRPNVAAGALATAPGAVAVRGPGYRGGDDANDNDNNEDDISTVRGGGTEGGENNDEGASDDAPLKVDSYVVKAVKNGPTDEEIRQRILASTPRAEAVTILASERKPRWNRARVFLLGCVVAAAAVVAGVSVSLDKRSEPTDPTDFLGSIYYIEWPRLWWTGHALSMYAYLYLNGDQLLAEGSHGGIDCRPKACLVSEESCVGGKFYSPGCCAGQHCPLETKCGEQCSPTDSCHLKDPINRTCVLSECYTCDQKDGKDLYSVEDKYFEFDCVEFGTAIRPENGQMYKWAIFCGPTRQGMYDDNAEYPDDGEYQCGAVRLGANFSDDSGGLVAATFPCKFIAQTECGCGSNSTCLPDSGCPFLCANAGDTNARDSCRSFPGNISWWEGRNAFNRSWFLEARMAWEYEFFIDIDGVDS